MSASGSSTHDIGAGSSGLSVTRNIRAAHPSCPPAQVATCRSNLDSAYSLLPGFSCAEAGSGHQSFRFSVFLSNPLTVLGQTEPDFTEFSLDDIMVWLDVRVADGWIKELPAIEACSKEPLLMPGRSTRHSQSLNSYGQYDSALFICYKTFCLEFEARNVTCTGSTYSHGAEDTANMLLKAGLAAVKALSECVSHEDSVYYLNLTGCSVSADAQQYCKSLTLIQKADASSEVDSTIHYIFSCQLISTSNVCNVTLPEVSFFYGDHRYTFGPVNNYSSLNTARSDGRTVVKKAQPCIDLPQSAPETFQKEVDGALLAQARSDLASHITEHQAAFTSVKGPATDTYTFVALVVSTAVSVILGVSWPFTDFALKQICRRRPRHLTCQKSHGLVACTCRVVKACWHMTCNIMVGTLFFLPVLSVVPNELERQRPFHTWDLMSRDLDLQHNAEPTQRFRVVSMLSATSRYDSQFLIAIATVVGLTCLLVAACTAWRCFQVFQRYDLLGQLQCGVVEAVPIQGVHDASAASAAASAQALVQRAFKAIEMTDAECLGITRKTGHLSSN